MIDIPLKEKIRNLRSRIVRWYTKNKRMYPWRTTDDPYRVLIAEMMLRRTKADQVETVYNRFISEYPTVEKLSQAHRSRLKNVLYPLGLKWRIPAFQFIAKDICSKYGCKVPDSREKLESLPGVGEYVAGAVLSIGYEKKEWIVDSNIVRLFKRYFNIKTSKEGRRDKHIIELAKEYVFCKDPKKANLAILDFSSLVCVPKKTYCSGCCLGEICMKKYN